MRPTDPQKKASPLKALATLVPPDQIFMLHHFVGTGRRHKWLRGKWFRPTLTQADIPVAWPTDSAADSGSCRQIKTTSIQICVCENIWNMVPIAQGPWHRTWAPSNYMGRCVFGSTTCIFDLWALHLDASPPLLAQAQAQTKTAHTSVSGSPDLNQTEENSINMYVYIYIYWYYCQPARSQSTSNKVSFFSASST